MGADIHIICEVKENGIWIVNPVEIFPYEKWDSVDDKAVNNTYYSTEPESYRYYAWFSLLVGVRKSTNLPNIVPIRGVPEDATTDWKDYTRRWKGDLHSISYVTLEDFDAFDWSLTTPLNALISFEDYKILKGTRARPDKFNSFRNISKNEVEISEEEADLILADELFHVTDRRGNGDTTVKHISECSLVVDYEWDQPIVSMFSEKFDSTIVPMRALSVKYEDVRIMIGFDN